MHQTIQQHLEALHRLQRLFFESQGDRLIQCAALVSQAFQRGKKLLLMGNGGSAADAQHIAAEFVNRFLIDRPPLPALALSTDTSVITSIGNDFGFDRIFEKQIQALGQPGDILMAISTSGNSPNILRGLQAAQEKGVQTLALTGQDGGRMVQWSDYALIVPSAETPLIQETHMVIGHLLCQMVEADLFPRKL
ncbi:MAG TPA: D-sedoheptulose 7-phosphate isomerase [Thermodesulfobacteriota bacterium]|nr:D-sedoheptulose 7-phosphate isomerase [Thermodesulfobacteriota bacterium]